LENGICRKYGIFCAKAHKRSELRNLIKIYGANWKVHYDISLREMYSKKIGNPLPILGKRDEITEGDDITLTYGEKFMNLVQSEIKDYLCAINNQCASVGGETVSNFPKAVASQQFNVYRCQSNRNEVNDYIDLYSAHKPHEKIYSGEVIPKEIRPLLHEFSCKSFSIGTSKEEYYSDDASNSFSYFSNEMDTNDESVDSQSNTKACGRYCDSTVESDMAE